MQFSLFEITIFSVALLYIAFLFWVIYQLMTCKTIKDMTKAVLVFLTLLFPVMGSIITLIILFFHNRNNSLEASVLE